MGIVLCDVKGISGSVVGAGSPKSEAAAWNATQATNDKWLARPGRENPEYPPGSPAQLQDSLDGMTRKAKHQQGREQKKMKRLNEQDQE